MSLRSDFETQWHSESSVCSIHTEPFFRAQVGLGGWPSGLTRPSDQSAPIRYLLPDSAQNKGDALLSESILSSLIPKRSTSRPPSSGCLLTFIHYLCPVPKVDCLMRSGEDTVACSSSRYSSIADAMALWKAIWPTLCK